MGEFITLAQIDETAAKLLSLTTYRPKIGVILGSGLGPLADIVEKPDIIPFNTLPHWPVSTVPGHMGRLVIGYLQGKQVLIMQGRAHYYEGYSMSQVGLPVRVMQRLGIGLGTGALIITNAAGAVNPAFEPGDLMLILDHLNLIGMAGQSSLRGPNIDELGPRFPDMGQAYDRVLCALARQISVEQRMLLREGVYACLAGPSFETPADLRYLRGAGVDAVGMSTVPEVSVARHGGQRVLGISGISNKANLDGNTLTTHEEVLAAGRMLVPKLTTLIREVISRLP